MIKARAWPVRAMYMLIVAALAISLFIAAAPAQKVSGACTADVCAEWTRVSTPTTDGWLLSPDSVIYDYALADGGDVAYAIVYVYPGGISPLASGYYLLKSEDGAATWDDITAALEDVDTANNITSLVQVATDWEDPDFVAVALWEGGELRVYISDDGGDTFVDAGEVVDGGVYLSIVSDLAVSYEDDGEREIAIGGQDDSLNAALFRCTADGDNPGAWEDATDYAGAYDGWDDDGTGNFATYPSALVTDIIFSPSWPTDRTIMVVTATNESAVVGPSCLYYTGDVYLQTGVWGATSEAWNSAAGFADAVPILENIDIPYWLMYYDARSIAGITLPMDYDGSDTDMRYSWVWVNYYDGADSVGEIYRVRDDSVDIVDTQISKTPWLTNVSYLGYIAEGKAIAGLLADSIDDYICNTDLIKECCEGVQVYRNDGITNMEICCLEWDKACKPPTGRVSMAVSYVSDDKAYAVALGESPGPIYIDEGAWSVSFDDGDTWNQLSLIDTVIDYLSDVAVSPDCNKTMLVSVNLYEYVRLGDACGCDSVWVYADDFPEAGYDEYSGHWLRTWCGMLMGDNSGDFPWAPQRGLLRLAPEETDGMTVYLVDRMTDTVYYNSLETLACWEQGTATVDEIVDLAVKDESTIYALDWDGDVAMSDDHGAALTWTTPVDSKVDAGWTIVVHGDSILVGGQDGDVSYSDDEGETFTALDDVYTGSDVHVTVAFDTYFDQNDTIYAALANAGAGNNGIFLWIIGGDPEEWHKLAANDDFNYTGLVLDRPSPSNPYTSPETGGVLYASYHTWTDNCDDCGCPEGNDVCWDTGVARCLTPITEICCDAGVAGWDYLTWGLETYTKFIMPPQALKICGCLTADSNSKLYAIDGDALGDFGEYGYDMEEGLDGTVWTFEDCYAKKAVDLVSPVDGFVVPADVCECCNSPFAIKWDRLCDACCYEIQFARDEDFTDIVPITEDFDCYCPLAPTTPSAWLDCISAFTPEFTYYWRVRASQAETCQEIHSWWSEPLSFKVSPTASAAAISLVSPEAGATDVATDEVGFSWNLMASWDEFDWVLDNNSDFSSPVESMTGLTDTAYGCTKTLDNDATYYWQVTAYKDGSAIAMSAVGTFRTVAEEEEIVTPPAVTPVWVWVVIAIGAVLVIVVIVLIFRTRRV